MSEAMDQEIGRILAVLDAVDPDAYVIFLGDSRTVRQATEAPFDPTHAKDTMYEGGVNVPLVIRGPGIRAGDCQGLVSVVVLYAMIAEHARPFETTSLSGALTPAQQSALDRLRVRVVALGVS